MTQRVGKILKATWLFILLGSLILLLILLMWPELSIYLKATSGGCEAVRVELGQGVGEAHLPFREIDTEEYVQEERRKMESFWKEIGFIPPESAENDPEKP